MYVSTCSVIIQYCCSTVYCSSIDCFVGGTAVGTGLNTRVGFAEKVAAKVAEFTGETRVYITVVVLMAPQTDFMDF